MKKFFAVALILFLSHLSAQTAYKYKGEFGEAQQKEVILSADSLFYFTPNIALNVSTNHLRAYKDIPVDKVFQPGYLEEQMELLKKHPDNAFVFYNNIANYFQNKGDQKNAQEYYTKALANLKLQPKAKDSASYYSYRGIIKYNLGQEGAADMEKALSINKSDSLSMVFYPLFLVGKNDISKAKTIVLDALDDKGNNMKEISYLMMGMVEMYGVVVAFSGLDEEQTKKFLDRDITKFIDLEPYNKYMDSSNSMYLKAKQMLGIFNGIIRYSPGLEPGGSFTPNKSDMAYMEEKERFFKKLLKEKDANLYGAYFSLGIINYAQKKFPGALSYFEKAITAFPKDKEGFQFNLVEIYDNMAGIYYMKKDYDKVREVLSKKLTVKSSSNAVLKDAHMNIAGIYLEEGKLAEAEASARAALEIEDSFAANSLLAYVSFKRNYSMSAEKYLQKAMSQIGNEADLCTIMTFVAAIQMHNGSPDGAYAVYNDHKSYLGTVECDCGELLERYVTPNK